MPSRFSMCKVEAETLDHLFLHCEVARRIWITCFSVFDVQWVTMHSVWSFLESWRCLNKEKSIIANWNMMPHKIFLCYMGRAQ